jgi:hypothetical protein
MDGERLAVLMLMRIGTALGLPDPACSLGRVGGRIIRIHTRETEYKGHPRHASEDEPQYVIKSAEMEPIAMHKGGALRKDV